MVDSAEFQAGVASVRAMQDSEVVPDLERTVVALNASKDDELMFDVAYRNLAQLCWVSSPFYDGAQMLGGTAGDSCLRVYPAPAAAPLLNPHRRPSLPSLPACLQPS